MVPRTDFSRTVTAGHSCEASRCAQAPALISASEGSSLRSKARTEAVLSIGLDMLISLCDGVFDETGCAPAVEPFVRLGVVIPKQVR